MDRRLSPLFYIINGALPAKYGFFAMTTDEAHSSRRQALATVLRLIGVIGANRAADDSWPGSIIFHMGLEAALTMYAATVWTAELPQR